MKPIYQILSISGTDPSGGAGMQADLKTFAALGAYGASVITAVVAQNTLGIQKIFSVSEECIKYQINSIINDLKIDAIKIGMILTSDIIYIISEILKKFSIPWVVLDPVIFAKDGSRLLNEESEDVLKNILIPLASIITPNLLEAGLLLGSSTACNEQEMKIQGKALLKYGCKYVLMKGGHLNTKNSPDWLISKNAEIRFNSTRIATNNTHGTGCTLSAALAALRPKCNSWEVTVKLAKNWLYGAILNADQLNIGSGKGPLNHFYEIWQ
ncbi:MAG: bifunctional hydroxymethylpyrimidine kinase/phosphomethylpyrimidine kinase [Wigglesworthia glossinidia]|uniref:Pyridoxamine kinase/Phosphomethylpyrimidine kinase domain-containing protein n=1 Tax=Glossina palpalis gambiensis TaxID=67801 RepID=A0A1B0C176_9MUSC|nr:bifunctional hydroxymethylpyrimidine kinase/phosphomethylpyrimidine kinase [Wigglesworthia glossinidia]